MYSFTFKNKIKLQGLLFIFLNTCLYTACIKDEKFTSTNEGTIYMPQAYGDKASLELFKLDSAQDITFGAAYGGLKAAGGDIAATFIVDTTLIAEYNASHASSYVVFPTDAYTISGLTATIKSGKTSSDALTIAVLTNKLDVSTKYMLPIKMTSVVGGNLDTSLSVAYFRIDALTQRERDITGTGVISVSDENSGGSGAGEGSPKLVDNDLGTKFLTFDYNADFWYQLKFGAAQIISAYTFTSANDAPERDPKNWTLEGSNDGTAWDVLDTHTDETFQDRTFTRRFEIPNTTAYTYYRVNVTENGGSSLFQMAEWRMIQYY